MGQKCYVNNVLKAREVIRIWNNIRLLAERRKSVSGRTEESSSTTWVMRRCTWLLFSVIAHDGRWQRMNYEKAFSMKRLARLLFCSHSTSSYAVCANICLAIKGHRALAMWSRSRLYGHFYFSSVAFKRKWNVILWFRRSECQWRAQWTSCHVVDISPSREQKSDVVVIGKFQWWMKLWISSSNSHVNLLKLLHRTSACCESQQAQFVCHVICRLWSNCTESWKCKF